MKLASTVAMLGALVVGVLLVGTSTLPWPVRLVYNPSVSAPIGWYRVRSVVMLRPHDRVLAWLPEAVAAFADGRRYLPHGVPILKTVGAVAGQRVCVRQGVVSIDGVNVASILRRDGSGRPLTSWGECRALRKDEIFLLGERSDASFDSRYFGPVSRSAVIGRAIALWTW